MPSKNRLISLLSQFAEVMERCFHKYLYNIVISNHILISVQLGFLIIALFLTLYKVTQPRKSFITYTINSVKRLIMVKRCELFSVILVGPLTESVTRVCYISFVV